MGNGEVGDQVAKSICVEDGSNKASTGEPGWCDCGAAHGVFDERPESRWFDSSGQVGGDWGEDVAAMESGGGIREPIARLIEMADLCRSVGESEREEAIIGADEEVTGCFDEERAALTADSRVDDGDVDRGFGELAPRLLEEKSAFENTECGDFMGDVNDQRLRRDGEDYAFHDGDEVIGVAEVRE